MPQAVQCKSDNMVYVFYKCNVYYFNYFGQKSDCTHHNIFECKEQQITIYFCKYAKFWGSTTWSLDRDNFIKCIYEGENKPPKSIRANVQTPVLIFLADIFGATVLGIPVQVHVNMWPGIRGQKPKQSKQKTTTVRSWLPYQLIHTCYLKQVPNCYLSPVITSRFCCKVIHVLKMWTSSLVTTCECATNSNSK